jgi:hypothetical protein
MVAKAYRYQPLRRGKALPLHVFGIKSTQKYVETHQVVIWAFSEPLISRVNKAQRSVTGWLLALSKP